MLWVLDKDLTDWYQTLTGVRQGCILSPQLFNILLELVITTSIEDSNIGLKLNGSTVNNLRFADDIALMTESEADLQTLVDLVHTASKQFGLTINIGKTEDRSPGYQIKNLNLSPSSSRERPWTKFNPSHILGMSSMKMPLVLMTSREELGLPWVTCRNSQWSGGQKKSPSPPKWNCTEFWFYQLLPMDPHHHNTKSS